MFATDEYKWRRFTPKNSNLEGESVKIGSWLNKQRTRTSPNSERYPLLKEHRMLEPIVRGQGEAKNYKT
jgi:hypothetical protein